MRVPVERLASVSTSFKELSLPGYVHQQVSLDQIRIPFPLVVVVYDLDFTISAQLNDLS